MFDVDALYQGVVSQVDHAVEQEVFESAAWLEQTGVFTVFARSAQFRDIVDWLFGHFGQSLVRSHDYAGLMLEMMYLQCREPGEVQVLSEYESLTARFLQERGMPVDVYASYFGWQDFDVVELFRQGTVVRIDDIGDETWREFEDTFYEGDDSHSGFSAYVTLDTGVQRYVRYEGSLADVMKYYAVT